jgi:hypothetical protein
MAVSGFNLLTEVSLYTTYKDKKGRTIRVPLSTDFQKAITNIIVQKNMLSVSLVTIQLTDPYRKLLNDEKIVQIGSTLGLDGQTYNLVQFVKAGDQMQLVFEPSLVHKLRNQRGVISSGTSTAVTEFMSSLVGAVGGKFKGPKYSSVWGYVSKQKIFSIPLTRGTAPDAYEDSWTAMSRIAGGIGWRLWEDDGTVYFGPDEYWFGKIPKIPMPINQINNTLGGNMQVIQEFTRKVQYLDFDWDVNKPLGGATVTCMLEDWKYRLGEIVKIQGVGIGNGNWMITSMQQDMFMPNASMTLIVPMPYEQLVNPTSLPLKPIPFA